MEQNTEDELKKEMERIQTRVNFLSNTMKKGRMADADRKLMKIEKNGLEEQLKSMRIDLRKFSVETELNSSRKASTRAEAKTNGLLEDQLRKINFAEDKMNVSSGRSTVRNLTV